MKRFILVSIGLMCLVVATRFQGACSAPQKTGMSAEYAIYSAVVNRFYVTKKIKLIVIKASTVAYNEVQLRKLKSDMPKVKSSFNAASLENFVQKNTKAKQLDRKFSLSVPYDFFEFDKMSTHEQWEDFFKRFPKARGAISLTQPGFSKDGTKAFLLVTYQIYAGLGEEWALQLTKKGSKWVVTDKYLLFRS